MWNISPNNPQYWLPPFNMHSFSTSIVLWTRPISTTLLSLAITFPTINRSPVFGIRDMNQVKPIERLPIHEYAQNRLVRKLFPNQGTKASIGSCTDRVYFILRLFLTENQKKAKNLKSTEKKMHAKTYREVIHLQSALIRSLPTTAARVST